MDTLPRVPSMLTINRDNKWSTGRSEICCRSRTYTLYVKLQVALNIARLEYERLHKTCRLLYCQLFEKWASVVESNTTVC